MIEKASIIGRCTSNPDDRGLTGNCPFVSRGLELRVHGFCPTGTHFGSMFMVVDPLDTQEIMEVMSGADGIGQNGEYRLVKITVEAL